jgi:hypothetical protein
MCVVFIVAPKKNVVNPIQMFARGEVVSECLRFT